MPYADQHKLSLTRCVAASARLAQRMLFSVLALSSVLQARAAKHAEGLPKPIATIAVTPLGFHPPGEIYLLGRLSSTTLDFVDDAHLLFTFHESRLMHREPEAFHDDQNIRATVLDIASGKTDATADWRMHDRLRYLLPARRRHLSGTAGKRDREDGSQPGVAPLPEIQRAPAERRAIT